MSTTLTAKRRGRKPATARYADPADLTQQYLQYFEALPATTSALANAAYHLRYLGLCEERQLLNPADYPEQLETDAFDSRAQQAVLCYLPDNRFIGTIRLIMPDARAPLPSVALAPVLQQDCPVESTAEVSRFIIAKEFRRRWNDGEYGAVSPWLDGDNQRRIPHVSLGLLRVLLQMARAAHITHLSALAEPALLRVLEGLGLYFAPVGPLVECHGLRQPCYAKIESLLRRLKQERPEVWHFITFGNKLD